MSALSYKHVSGGGVPGGHNVISRGIRSTISQDAEAAAWPDW